MTAIASLLESFDAAPQKPEGPGPDWLAGHAAGVEAGRAAQRAEAAALEARLVTRLEDMAFAHAEARAGLMTALGGLFDMLTSQLLPGLTGTIAGAQLREALHAAAMADLSTPLELHLSEDALAAMAPVIEEHAGSWLHIRADPTLSPGEARLTGASRPETHLDSAALIEFAQQALSALCAPKEDLTDHG